MRALCSSRPRSGLTAAHRRRPIRCPASLEASPVAAAPLVDRAEELSSSPPLHVVTPLVYSDPLSRAAGLPVFLKLEGSQPCGSFKLRGIGAACQAAAARGATALVSSSGGNAGLAVAHSARALRLPATVVLPTTSLPSVRARLQAYGATVVLFGSCWAEAHRHAESLPGALIHPFLPFKGTDTWTGHASLVTECAEQLPVAAAAAGASPALSRLAAGGPPGALVCSVGGGGLLMGCLLGAASVGWDATHVIAVETAGAACLAAALAAGRVVTLPELTSVASSLGAPAVCDAAFAAASQQPMSFNPSAPIQRGAGAFSSGLPRVVSSVVSDAEAVAACVSFLDDHRSLVEPACGAALAEAYLWKERAAARAASLPSSSPPSSSSHAPSSPTNPPDSLLVVVCGGACVDAAGLQALAATLGVQRL